MARSSGSRVRLAAVILGAALAVPLSIVASPGLALGATAPCRATNTTTHATKGNLFQALNGASAGQTLVITGTCKGDFVLKKPITLKKGAKPATLLGAGSRTVMVTTSVGAGTVKLIGLRITGGVAFTCPAYSGYACGAGIYNMGKMSLSHVTVTGNEASSDGLGGDGAGIFNAPGAVMAIDASTISGNTSNGPVTSFGAYAGGIDNEGTMTISRSTIRGNVADAGASGNSEAGGILNYQGTLTITTTTIVGNRVSHDAVPHGASLRTSDGGGIVNDNGTLRISSSTISANIARADATAEGGGLLAYSGSVTLTNVTLSGNQAVLNGTAAGGTVRGAGLADLGASTFHVTDTTITENTVKDLTGSATQKAGGGAYSTAAPLFTASIIAGNTAPTATDCAFGAATGSGGHDLIGDGSGCGGSFVNGTNGDKVGVSAGLGPLAANGGPTRTHALLAGSKAIDMAGLAPCDAHKDQRGVARPQGAKCDAGAFEKQ